MTTAIVSMSRNEADIAASWASYHVKQVDLILVADGMSTDGTPEILRRFGIEVVHDENEVCKQAEVMTALAHQAAARGAEWIIPADLDEFWVSTTGDTLADTLGASNEDRHYASVWQHLDRVRRFTDPQRLPKCCFRYQPDAEIVMGNHDVKNVPANYTTDLLQIREWPYRSKRHFREKVKARIATLDPELVEGDASHYKRLIGLTDEELDAEFAEFCARDYVVDPLP